MKIPFVSSALRRFSYNLLLIGELLSSLFPGTRTELIHSGLLERYKVTPCLYFSITFVWATIAGLSSLFVFSLLTKKAVISGFLAAFAFCLALAQCILYPRLFTARRVKDIDQHLLPSLYTMLIQLKAGISIYKSFSTLSNGGYGEVSKVFEDLVKNVEVGRPTPECLEELAIRSPSSRMRRFLWNLATAMRAGKAYQGVEESIATLRRECLITASSYFSFLSFLLLTFAAVAVVPGLAFLVDSGKPWHVLLGCSVVLAFLVALARLSRPTLLES